MRIRLSQPLEQALPDLQRHLAEVAFMCSCIDRDISTRNLYVEARTCSYEGFSGTAHPFPWTYDRRWRKSHTNLHTDGKITMTLHRDCKFAAVARLFSHELRHIGQFHRGRQRFGRMTIATLKPHEAENDAYEFEDVILGRLGLA